MSRLIQTIFGIAAVIVCICITSTALSQNTDNLPRTTHLFWGGYCYTKLVDYYKRSLANFKTLSTVEKNRDRDIMIGLSVRGVERSARALECEPEVMDAINALGDELSARGAPKQFRIEAIRSFEKCADNYSSTVKTYWSMGRDLGELAFLFENLSHPQVQLLEHAPTRIRPNAFDREILQQLDNLGESSILLYGTKGFPPHAEALLKELESIRIASVGKTELSTETRDQIKRCVDEISKSFYP